MFNQYITNVIKNHNRVVNIGCMDKRKLLDTLGGRLRFARQARGLSQAELAVRVGCSQGAIGNIERNLRDGRGDTLIHTADVLGVSYQWLREGLGEMESPSHQLAEPVAVYAETGLEPIRLPLLTSDEVLRRHVHKHPGVRATEWVTLRRRDIDPGAFAFKVVGESMAWQGVPTFPEGTLLVVSVQRAPRAGDFVLAHDGTQTGVTFKKLTTDGIDWYLKPLAPGFGTLKIDDPQVQVMGVVVEYWFGGAL